MDHCHPNTSKRASCWDTSLIFGLVILIFLIAGALVVILYRVQHKTGDHEAQILRDKAKTEISITLTYIQAKNWLSQNGFEIENAPSGHWAFDKDTVDESGKVHSMNVVQGFKCVCPSIFSTLSYWIEFDFQFSSESIADVIARGYSGGHFIGYAIKADCRAPSSRRFVTQPER